MNQQSQLLPREHHFYAAIAKFLFYHSEHGIVLVQDPIRLKNAEQYGLSPLILYGLAVAGLPIRWMTFTPITQPRSFQNVLTEAWHNAEGLRGRPDILRVNHSLVSASPELMQRMVKIGVQVEIAGPKEKSLPASLRSAQESSKWLMMRHGSKVGTHAGAIQALCQCAQYDHESDVRHSGVTNRDMKARIQRWLALPAQESMRTSVDGLDWELGTWLSSWESSLPPEPPRYFKFDWSYCGAWLMTGEKAPDDIVEDDYFEADGYYDNAAEIAKNLVACWPNSPSEIAKNAGFTLRELQWFLTGKAPLERQHRFSLENLLGIQYDERMGKYVGAGPYALIAQKPKALEDFYLAISHGGDAHPCEIIPSHGAADPSWRYIFISTYCEPPSIVMAPRGEKITERLPDLLLNYAGTTLVSPEFYRDVVSTCARACREPTANIHEMTDFAERYDAHWKNCAWLPE